MTGEMKPGQRVFIMARDEDIHGRIVGFMESCGQLFAKVQWEQGGVIQGVPLFKLRRAD